MYSSQTLSHCLFLKVSNKDLAVRERFPQLVLHIVYQSQIYIFQKYIRTNFVHFEVKNEVLGSCCCGGVFRSTSRDDQMIYQTKHWNKLEISLQKKILKNLFYINRNIKLEPTKKINFVRQKPCLMDSVQTNRQTDARQTARSVNN